MFDNQAAFSSMEAGLKDPSSSQCMFMQAFSKIGNARGAQYRARVRLRALQLMVAPSFLLPLASTR